MSKFSINCDMNKDILNEKISSIIDKCVNDTELIKKLIGAFSEKGIPTRLIPQLFEDNLELEDLSKIQLICLTECLYKHFKDSSLNPDKFFSNTSKSEYLNYENKEVILDTMDFDLFQKVNNYFFTGILTYKQIYCYIRDGLITYEKESQRKSKYIKSPKSGTYYRKASINKRSVKEIADLMLNDKFFETEIILNCQLIKGKKQEVKYEKVIDDKIYNIKITPDYDLTSDTTTVVNLNDGGHRVASIILATNVYKEKYGEDAWLEGVVPVQLRFMTLSTASQLVAQIFKRSDIGDKNWQRAIEENDYSKFADLIISQCYLKGKVGKIYEDTFINKNITTYKLVMSDTIKKLGIEVNDKSVTLFESKDIAEKIDILYSLIDKDTYPILNKYKDDVNIPIIYIAIAYLLKDKSLVIDDYLKILKELNGITEDEYKKLKLSNKNYNVENLIDFARKVIQEVNRNEN